MRSLLYTIIILSAFFYTNDFVLLAQEPDTTQKDSLKIYYDIKEIAKKRKATYWIYKVIFRDPSNLTPQKVEQKQKKEQNKYLKYKGKIVRKIDVISLDPFGTKINDTIVDTENPIERFGNQLHVSTKPFAVINNLLFKPGDAIDPLEFKESERIIRQTEYIREAKIEVYPVAGTDSADVFIAVQDIWSLQGKISGSTTKSELTIRERNFAGMGHDLNNRLNFNFKEKPSFFVTGDYNIPNLHHSFVSSTIYYNTSNLNKYIGLNLQRPFYSPLTDWAGGINVLNNRVKVLYANDEGINEYSNVGFKLEDLWIGRSFQFKKGESDKDRSDRIVVAARIMNRRYNERPDHATLREIYQNTTLVLGSIGLSSRTYYKDWNIYKFSQTEDVPEGRLFAFTSGIQKRELGDRIYLGFEISSGSHINNFGYLSRSLQIGSFLNFSKAEDGIVRLDLSYFTDLLIFGNWSFRQFIRYRITHGFNWAPYINLNINNEHGLFGFNSPLVYGKNKMVLNLESVIYLPYDVLGFQFAPILLAGFGLVGNEDQPIIRSKVFQFYGLGLLIRNEMLVANNFQLSIGFYPDIPGIGTSKIKLNPIGNYNYNFKDFYLSQPGMIPFE